MIVGVDPGLKGALCHYDGARFDVVQMPTFKAKAGQRGTLRDFPNRAAILTVLQKFKILGAEVLAIELVGGIPGQAAHAAFTFGHGAGFIEGAAEALGYRVERVPPMVWKSALKVPSDKKLAIARATALLPAWVNLWTAGGDLDRRSGRAEAALIALYGWQVSGPLA